MNRARGSLVISDYFIHIVDAIWNCKAVAVWVIKRIESSTNIEEAELRGGPLLGT